MLHNCSRTRPPITVTELQKTVRPDAEAKSIRLDLYVEDDENAMYAVEMQAGDTGELSKRSRG